MKKLAKKEKYEGSKTDKKLDSAEKKKGIKEGSKKDNAVDAVAKKKGYAAGKANLAEILKRKVKNNGNKIKPENEGKLHEKLGIKKGDKIPVSKLKVKKTDSPKLVKEKTFAKNAGKWNKKGGK